MSVIGGNGQVTGVGCDRDELGDNIIEERAITDVREKGFFQFGRLQLSKAVHIVLSG